MALLVRHLVFTFAAGTDPHTFFNNFLKYTLQIVPALLQIVPGLKGSKIAVTVVDKQANWTANGCQRKKTLHNIISSQYPPSFRGGGGGKN